MKKKYEVVAVELILLKDASIDCLSSSIESIDSNADGHWADGWN